MPALILTDLSKSYGNMPAVSDVSLTAEHGELVCLLGPSGCGKTTLLRLIAGLEFPDSGTIAFDGVDLRGVAPHMRGFGLMFQDLALFPHMDVYRNVGFGLRMQGVATGEIRRRADELLELVDLAGFGDRKVHELSGGERQRVALARSLAPEPKLLMLDEPLGSLDRVLRESLQSEVRSILKEVGVMAIHVTHDREEAYAIADTIVVMDRGSLVQAGSPEALYKDPANELVARSLGVRNIVSGTLARADGPAQVVCALGTLAVGWPVPSEVPVGGDVLALIDERTVSVIPARDAITSAGSTLAGTITAREFRGGESALHVSVGDGTIVCLVVSRDAGTAAHVGDEVSVVVPPEAVRLLARGDP